MKNQLTTLANQPMGRKAERRIELMQEWKVVIDAWEKLWEENKKVHEVESRRERGERMEREERECVEIEMMHMRKEAVWQATGPKYLSSDQKKEELRLPEWLKRYAARVEDADEEDEDKKPVMHRFPY